MFIFLYVDIQFQYCSSKRLAFPYWITLAPLLKVNQLIYSYVSVYFWNSLFCSIDLYVCFYISTNSFDYCRFTVSLEIRSIKSSNFVLYQNCHLHFHINFRNNLSISTKRPAGAVLNVQLSLHWAVHSNYKLNIWNFRN